MLLLFENKTSRAAQQNWLCFSTALRCLPQRRGGLGGGLSLAEWGRGGQTALCGTILMPMAWSHLQLKELWATGPAALHIAPGATLAAGLSDLVL